MQCEYDNGRQCPKGATVIYVNSKFKAAACNEHRVATANKIAGHGEPKLTELAR